MRSSTCRFFLLSTLFSLIAVPLGFAADAGHTIPMELRHNLPFVQVTVNGKGPFTFGIDTGTGGQALVSPALIQQLSLPVTGETEVGDPSGQNSRKVPTVTLKSLSVAGVEFKDVQAVEHQPSPREGPCDGILGFVLFRDYLLTMDYPAKQFTLATGSLNSDGTAGIIPFTMPDNVPLIELSVGSQKIAAHVDSRGMGLSLPEKIAGELKFLSPPVVIGRGRTVSNDFEIKGAQLAGDIQVAGYTFSQPFVALNPLFPVGNFGAMALQHFAVTFDQKNKLLRLAATEKTIVLPPPHRVEGAPSQSQP